MPCRANTVFLSSIIQLDMAMLGNFLNYLCTTSACLSELGGIADQHRQSSSACLAGCLGLPCHVLLLGWAHISFQLEGASSGCLWNQALVSGRSSCPSSAWGQPSAGVSTELSSSLELLREMYTAILSPLHVYERALFRSGSKSTLWKLKFNIPCLPFIYSVCTVVNVVSPTASLF